MGQQMVQPVAVEHSGRLHSKAQQCWPGWQNAAKTSLLVSRSKQSLVKQLLALEFVARGCLSHCRFIKAADPPRGVELHLHPHGIPPADWRGNRRCRQQICFDNWQGATACGRTSRQARPPDTLFETQPGCAYFNCNADLASCSSLARRGGHSRSSGGHPKQHLQI